VYAVLIVLLYMILRTRRPPFDSAGYPCIDRWPWSEDGVASMGRPIPSRNRWEVPGINNDSIPGLCQNTMIPPILPPEKSLLDVSVAESKPRGKHCHFETCFVGGEADKETLGLT